MKNLVSLMLAVVFGAACFVPAPASAYYYGGRYYHITIGGITTHTSTEAITTNIAIAGITIGAAPGLSASTGVQDIIGIGKRITVARSPFFEKQAQTPAIDSTYTVL